MSSSVRRALLVLVVFGCLAIPAARAQSPVDVDTKLFWSCREVSLPGFADSQPDRKIIEASIRISANFLVDEKQVDFVMYRFNVPASLELLDYLPKTELATDVAGPVTTTGQV